MALPSWASQSIIRLRAKTKESRGSIIPDWSNPEQLTIRGCSVQPAGTSLTQDGRIQGITDGYTCYAPQGADIKAGDRIRYEGQDYVINGEPRIWQSPTGRATHMQINLERWEG